MCAIPKKISELQRNYWLKREFLPGLSLNPPGALPEKGSRSSGKETLLDPINSPWDQWYLKNCFPLTPAPKERKSRRAYSISAESYPRTSRISCSETAWHMRE